MGNDAIVDLLLERIKALPVDQQDRVLNKAVNNKTPIIVAAEINAISIIRKLVGAGANINQSTTFGTALHAVVFPEFEPEDRPAEFLEEDDDRSTYYYVPPRPPAALLRELVALGANIHAKTGQYAPWVYEETPLHCAAKLNNPEYAKVLLELGANPDIPDAKIATPSMIASWRSEAMAKVFGVTYEPLEDPEQQKAIERMFEADI
jgi:ankyrin repeat protein